MEDIKVLFGVIFVLGFIFLLGWGSAKLCDAYYDYRAKRNRTNHPKLIELQKEREKVCEEYNRWWDEKYEAQKRIDKYTEELKYHEDQVKESLLNTIKQDQQIYTNADKHMKELSPLVDSAREAEQTYREEHNIHHW